MPPTYSRRAGRVAWFTCVICSQRGTHKRKKVGKSRVCANRLACPPSCWPGAPHAPHVSKLWGAYLRRRGAQVGHECQRVAHAASHAGQAAQLRHVGHACQGRAQEKRSEPRVRAAQPGIAQQRLSAAGSTTAQARPKPGLSAGQRAQRTWHARHDGRDGHDGHRRPLLRLHTLNLIDLGEWN